MAAKKTTKKTSKKTASTTKTLGVPRRDGISLMKTFGFTAPHKLTNDKLLMRLGKTSQYMEAFGGTLTGKDADLVEAIIAAGDNISIVGEGPAAAKSKGAKGAKGKAAPKAAKVKATPKTKRIDCVCAMLKKLPVKGASIEQVAKLANSMYIKAGGDDNEKQTLHHLRVVLPTLKSFGIVAVEKGKLFPVK